MSKEKLKGRGLAKAVALKREWHKREHRGAYRGGYSAWFWADSDDVDQVEVDCYNPHLNIAKAWELDGEGWLWSSIEGVGGVRMTVSINGALPAPFGCARWADHSTKAGAYATARCRAFLMVKEGIHNDA